MTPKKIVILGAGESGVGAAILARAQGLDVWVSDAGTIAPQYKEALRTHQIAFEEHTHTLSAVLDACEIVKSPGIPHSVPVVQAAIEAGIPIISEVELASRYTTAKLIGITGSNGKTTTAHLTYHILQQAGLHVGLAGNVGTSFARSVSQHQYDCYVLELSSFQLEDIEAFRPDVACLLNITPDHLDRYQGQMELYISAKFHLLRNMPPQACVVYNQDDTYIQARLASMATKPALHAISLHHEVMRGACAKYGQLHCTLNDHSFSIPQSSLKLLGQHNQYNALAAMTMAGLMGVTPQAIQAGLSTFAGVPHRMEWVTDIQGVAIYNDSKATNVAAAAAALASVDSPIIWIAGGQDKGNDYEALHPLVEERVKALVCLGKDNSKLLQHFGHTVKHTYATQDVMHAVSQALAWAAPGDTVLLSPACASFDLFANFEARGAAFKHAVLATQTQQQEQSAHTINPSASCNIPKPTSAAG